MKDLRWRREERQTAAMEEAGGSDDGKAEDAGAVDIGDVGEDSGDRRRRGRSKHFGPGAVLPCLATIVVYNPWKVIEEEEDKVQEEKRGETEEEGSSEMSEFDSSDCFSDEENEQLEEDTVIVESNFEETKEESALSNSKEYSKSKKKEEDENNDNKIETGGKVEKDGEGGLKCNNSLSPNNNSPIKEPKPIECDEPINQMSDSLDQVEQEVEVRIESPLIRVGLSDKLVKLLSRNTPIKEKLIEVEEEKNQDREDRGRNYTGDRERIQMEKRITRSQTRKANRRSYGEGNEFSREACQKDLG
ncbi:hypothetical protein L2E82_52608 [Cichorium intybus]|nr:hypothetical protein L2E82_52608 [Cichorium intybus]